MILKKFLIPVIIAATLMLFGLLFYLPLVGCNGAPTCCPQKTKTTLNAVPEYVCNPECVPGGNSITLYATIGYEENGIDCVPTKFSATLMNNTKTVEIKNIKWLNSSTGNYMASIQQNIDTNTWFELTAFGCPKLVTEIYEAKVLPSPYSFELCTAKGDLQGLGVWQFPSETNKYGKGIVIDKIENPATNKYEIEVQYQYKTAAPAYKIKPGDLPLNVYYPQKAGYGWQISISMEDWQQCKQDPKANDFCLKVYLICKCEKG